MDVKRIVAKVFFLSYVPILIILIISSILLLRNMKAYEQTCINDTNADLSKESTSILLNMMLFSFGYLARCIWAGVYLFIQENRSFEILLTILLINTVSDMVPLAPIVLSHHWNFSKQAEKKEEDRAPLEK